MSIAAFGSILVAMAGYARDRAQLRKDYLGPENTELLYAISHMLATGAERCAELATDVEDPRNEGAIS